MSEGECTVFMGRPKSGLSLINRGTSGYTLKQKGLLCKV